MTAADGKSYTMTCLNQNELLGWLYTVNPNKVKPEARDLLIKYQKETTGAINAYWEAKVKREPPLYETLVLRGRQITYSRRCKICRLPIADAINDRLDDYERFDDIVAWAAGQGHPISKAGLSRHCKHRMPPISTRSLMEDERLGVAVTHAKLVDEMQRRGLAGLSDEDLVKYAVALSLGRLRRK